MKMHMNDYRHGKKVESEFIRAYKQANPLAIIEIASIEMDKGHVDVVIDNITYDVKAIKNTHQNSNNYTIIELVNNDFWQGWLFAGADYIAFQSGSSENYVFLIVKKDELRQYCKGNIFMKTVQRLEDAVQKLYSRGNDIISVVDMNRLAALQSSYILEQAQADFNYYTIQAEKSVYKILQKNKQ